MSAYDPKLVAELLALDEKRTAGEWVYSPERDTHDCCVHVKGAASESVYIPLGDGGVVGSSEWIWLSNADALFIAAAPKLADQLRTASERIAQLERALTGLVGQIEQAREGFGIYHDSPSMNTALAEARTALAGEAGS